MKPSKIQLTEKTIATLPLSEKGRYIVRDTNLKGFIVIVGQNTKSYFINSEYWKNNKRQFTVKMKIGEVGEIGLREARLQAQEWLTLVAKGQKPGERQEELPSNSITLQQAWERYKDVHLVRKERSPKTIEEYAKHLNGVLGDWLDKPLAELAVDPAIVANRHDLITKDNGPYMANAAMRTLRTIYNHSLKTNPDLPEKNPTKAVDWNEEKRRDCGISEREIRPWFTQLYKLENPLRRELHLFLLLSGSRATAIKTAKIEHINFRRRVLFCPTPKGGAKKAFEIPLSQEMIRCLVRAIRLARIVTGNDKSEWLFPSDSESGHIVEHKEDRAVLSKWGNDLRQTYRNLGVVAGVDHLNMHLLMNHSLPGVNAGYITRNRLTETVLREAQQAISDVVMAEVAKDDKEEAKKDQTEARKNTAAIMNWLSSGRIILPSMSKSALRE